MTNMSMLLSCSSLLFASFQVLIVSFFVLLIHYTILFHEMVDARLFVSYFMKFPCGLIDMVYSTVALTNFKI